MRGSANSLPGLRGSLRVEVGKNGPLATGHGLRVNGQEGVPVPVVSGTPFSVSDGQHARELVISTATANGMLVDYAALTDK